MIQPIYLLGNPELRRIAEEIAVDSADIQSLIGDMLETMRHAKGIGLAAPQIGRHEKVFVIDVSALEKDFEEAELPMPEQPMVFINPKIVNSSEKESEFEEGCLSIPDIHEDVMRPDNVRIRYFGIDFRERDDTFSGMLARVIQHEYDHLEGILFIDHITALRRRLLKRRLKDIVAGDTEVDYPICALGKGSLV